MSRFLDRVIEAFKNISAFRALYRLPGIASAYHYILAFLGALFYGFPSRRMVVIGVTGTKGKTTTCNLIAQILNRAGHTTGMVTTVNIRIGDKEFPNTTRQTMLGRFELQRLLKQMADAGCTHAVIETSSEGILQYRHRFIDYRVAVFLNLMPEHLDRHGGPENYRKAKLKLFEQVARRKDGIGVYNLDDENAEFFLAPRIPQQYGYTLPGDDSPRPSFSPPPSPPSPVSPSFFHRFSTLKRFPITNVMLENRGARFVFDNERFETSLIGTFNVYNAAAAITIALALGVPEEKIKLALKNARAPRGRMEIVGSGQPFTVVIDYAYDPNGLEAALKAARVFKPRRTILMTGIAAGHRDRWQRKAMGKIADQYADIVVVTTDDPYDEDPNAIIDEVASGALENSKRALNKNLFKIADRREAIRTALSLAARGDLVLFAGKGGETAMKVAGGNKIPWDERKIVEEELGKL